MIFSINILGLSTGIAAFLLIVSFLDYEWSFDAFHPGAARIYRVVNEFKYEQGVDYQIGTPLPFGKTLKLDYPQLEGSAMIFWKNDNQIAVLDRSNIRTEKKFKEKLISMVEPGFFDMFSFKWVSGSPVLSLSDPNKVVLSRSMALKYFGDDQNVVGRTLQMDNNLLLQVTGVIEDPPANTDFQLKVVVSHSTLRNIQGVNMDDWQSIWKASQCFVKLPAGMTETSFDRDLITFLKRHQPNDNNHTYLLQRLKDMHSDSRYPPLSEKGISRQTIMALIIVALFLLILPSVNFINMQTAQAIRRSKEIGMYKVLGSSKWQLINRFLKETFFTVTVAVLIGFALAALVMPFINGSENALPGFGLLRSGRLIFILLALVITVTLLSGTYPAFILSNFKPTLALKGKITTRDVGGNLFRRILVVFQFSVSQVLTIITIVSLLQINYISKKDIGFNKQGILLVNLPLDSNSLAKAKYLKQQFASLPGVKSATLSSAPPLSDEEWKIGFGFRNLSQAEGFPLNLIMADNNYLNTYELKLLAGRFYGESDTIREVVVNEQFLRKETITSPSDVIGKLIQINMKNYPIVGVVKDFNNNSLKSDVDPLALVSQTKAYSVIGLKVSLDNIVGTMDRIKSIWAYEFPNFVLEDSFLDEKIARFYRNESDFYQLFKYFSILAILISCSGLFALASFVSLQRSKEIGIRKALGAGVFSIMRILSKEYVILFGISTVISWPLGWLAVSRYMEQFTYRIKIDPLIFLLSGALILVIVVLTVSYHTVKTALINPTKVLKVQ